MLKSSWLDRETKNSAVQCTWHIVSQVYLTLLKIRKNRFNWAENFSATIGIYLSIYLSIRVSGHFQREFKINLELILREYICMHV